MGPEKVSAAASSSKPAELSNSASERVKAEVGYIIAQGGGLFGNMADLAEDEILLPSFVKKKDDGYYMDLTEIDKNPRAFYDFADRTFSS